MLEIELAKGRVISRMKKLSVFIAIILMLLGCSHNPSSEPTDIGQSAPPAFDLTTPDRSADVDTLDVIDTYVITENDIDSFFDMTRIEIIELFGEEYELIGVGAEGSFEGHYFESVGLIFSFEYDDTIGFIVGTEDFQIRGARARMNFLQIQEFLGDAKIIEGWWETPDNIAYSIEYLIEKSKYKFVSFELDGSDSMLHILRGNRSETSQMDELPQMGFGYANIDGTKIIVLYSHEIEDNSSLVHFRYALGENGKSFEIEFDIYQERNPASNNRQTMWNFNNEPGCVYSVINNIAVPNETLMLLTEEQFNKTTVFQEDNSERGIVTNEMNGKYVDISNRKIKNSWIISEYSNGFQLIMIEFERINDDLLAWLVLEDSDGFSYCEFPATLDDVGYVGWRMGDRGELHEDWVYILTTTQIDETIIVYLGWYSEEGVGIDAISFRKNEIPSEKAVAGRYTYPV